MKRLWFFLCFLALTLAVAGPVAAQDLRDPTLNDSETPGSVIVFPEFLRGTVTTADQGVLPASSFEIAATCPVGSTCNEFQSIKVRFHWVCPGSGPFNVCREVDFNCFVTVKGKILLNPENSFNFPYNTNTCTVPPPPCNEGYLLGWVIDLADRPIKFDALIGEAVIRESGSAVAAYNAIPIQASTSLATFAPTDINANGKLDFDGTEYQAAPGRIYGDVRWHVLRAGGPPHQVETTLTLLTLDANSNRTNNPMFVDFNFYNESEQLHSTSTNFTCWQRVPILDLDASLNSGFGRKGLVESVRAEKIPFYFADSFGPATLLGVVITRERDPAAAGILRDYAYSLYNDGRPVPTAFTPNP